MDSITSAMASLLVLRLLLRTQAGSVQLLLFSVTNFPMNLVCAAACFSRLRRSVCPTLTVYYVLITFSRQPPYRSADDGGNYDENET